MTLKEQKTFCFQVKVNRDKCKSCQLCIFYCPVGYLVLSSRLNKKGVKFAETKKDNECIGCGFCYLICPDACIEIYEKEQNKEK